MPRRQKFLDEGVGFAEATKDENLEADFTYNSYQLAFHKKNYEQALSYLHTIYVRDSTLTNKHACIGLGPDEKAA